MKTSLKEKISQIRDFVAKNPGCTTHQIMEALGLSYETIYFASYAGTIRAEKDPRFKRVNIYFPVDIPTQILEVEKVPECR